MRLVWFSLRETLGLVAARRGVAAVVVLEMVERALVVVAREAGAAAAEMRAVIMAMALDEEAIAPVEKELQSNKDIRRKGQIRT